MLDSPLQAMPSLKYNYGLGNFYFSVKYILLRDNLSLIYMNCEIEKGNSS